MSLDPFPMVKQLISTLNLLLSHSLSIKALPSGYLFVPFNTLVTASIANGLGPKGFSLLAYLIAFLVPNSLSKSSIGLPGL